MKSLVLVALVVLLGFYLTWEDEITHGPGRVADAQPEQQKLSDVKSFSHEDYTIQPLASFDIKARVLAREDYSFGRESDLSPMDLALGWGPMSDETVLDEMEITQSGRWYRWSVEELPIPRRDIETNSANMHLIPATRQVEKAIDKVKKGHVVDIRGYLVKISASDGWRWQSSLTRQDTGANACELIWVEQFEIIKR